MQSRPPPRILHEVLALTSHLLGLNQAIQIQRTTRLDAHLHAFNVASSYGSPPCSKVAWFSSKHLRQSKYKKSRKFSSEIGAIFLPESTLIFPQSH